MPRYEHFRVRWNSPSECLDKNVPTDFRYCRKMTHHTREVILKVPYFRGSSPRALTGFGSFGWGAWLNRTANSSRGSYQNL